MSFFFLHYYYPFIFCKYTKINDFHVHHVNNITFRPINKIYRTLPVLPLS